MKQISNLSTKKKLKSQLTKTETKETEVKLSNFSTIAGVVVFLGATAPFWYMWADVGSKQEFMGFTNLRTFLFSFGNHFAYFCFASFALWMANFIDPKHKKLRRVINLLGGVFVGISAYFLLWVFNPYSDFPDYAYHIAFAISAVLIAYGVYLVNKFVTRVLLDKHYNMKNLIAFIFRVRNKHYQRVAVKAMHAETYNEPMVSEDTVKDNIQTFEEDFYETLDRVDNYK